MCTISADFSSLPVVKKVAEIKILVNIAFENVLLFKLTNYQVISIENDRLLMC